MEDHEPTETSPLLAKPGNVVPEPGDAPIGVLPTGNGVNGHLNGDVKSGDDGESQGEPDRITQYEGMPEVKAKLKYIMPAIAIGVRSPTSQMDFQLTDPRYFFPPETKLSLYQVMQR